MLVGRLVVVASDVVASGVNVMFKAGSFEIRRLITVQVPQSYLTNRRSDAIFDIGSREQNLSTGLKKRTFSHIISRSNLTNSDFSAGPLASN